MNNFTNKEFMQKMQNLCKQTIASIIIFSKDQAIEAHVFGSIARGTNDAFSDIDIWITYEDSKIKKIIEERLRFYEKFGQIILLHEMQNNFPLNGIQTAIIYKIEGELIRVDFYLCPLSSSRIMPNSKILFEYQKVERGAIIYEIKRTPRDLSDRITFLISMCFNSIKKVVRGDSLFVDFLTSEFQKCEKEIPELATVPRKPTFNMIRKALAVLNIVSNSEQKIAIIEINSFLSKIERL